jgi:hypothetical protein
MEMCPYCGEEVPADSAKCWKCGTELGGEGSTKPGSSDELEVPEDEDEAGETAGGERRAEMIPCPHCESPVSKKAVRCRACGRNVRAVKQSHAAAAWRWGTWLLVLGVAVAAVAAVATLSLKRQRASQVRTISGYKFEELEKKLQPLVPTSSERKREIWARDFEGKWVKWSGVVVTVDADTGHVTVAHTKGSKKADGEIEFRDDAREELRALNPDQPIVYSARLADFGKDGMAFSLSEGLIEK